MVLEPPYAKGGIGHPRGVCVREEGAKDKTQGQLTLLGREPQRAKTGQETWEGSSDKAMSPETGRGESSEIRAGVAGKHWGCKKNQGWRTSLNSVRCGRGSQGPSQ